MSSLTVEYIFFSQVSTPAAICCIIGVLNVYLPASWINEKIFGNSKPEFTKQTYEEMKDKFEYVNFFFGSWVL